MVVCTYLYVCKCVFICVLVCGRVNVCTHMSLYTRLCVCLRLCMCAYASLHVCMSMFVCVNQSELCVCQYVCVCVRLSLGLRPLMVVALAVLLLLLVQVRELGLVHQLLHQVLLPPHALTQALGHVWDQVRDERLDAVHQVLRMDTNQPISSEHVRGHMESYGDISANATIQLLCAYATSRIKDNQALRARQYSLRPGREIGVYVLL